MKTHDQRKIIQIIPAQDWYGMYEQEDGTMELDPIACWALVDDGQDRFVVGLAAADYVDFCENTSNFRGYKHKEHKQ